MEPLDVSDGGEQDGSLGPEQDGSLGPEDAGAMDASDEGGSLDASDAEVDASDAAPPAPCDEMCDAEFRNVVDCHGDIVSACSASQACSSVTRTCIDACQAAIDNKSPVGCNYYAVHMEQYLLGDCFAAVVANNSRAPLHIGVEYAGAALDVSSFAAIPSGSGKDLYGAYDAAAGLPPGEAAILFLSEGKEGDRCPKAAAVSDGDFHGTNVGDAFHITTDRPPSGRLPDRPLRHLGTGGGHAATPDERLGHQLPRRHRGAARRV